MQKSIAMLDVESSQICAIGHDPETNTLAVRFWRGFCEDKRPGGLYHYANFSAADFELFKNAESLGQHFKEHIRNETAKYPYELIEKEPLNPVA